MTERKTTRTAVAQVLDNADLVRLLARHLCPRDCARVRFVNKLWSNAAADAEEEYYRERWPPSPAALRAHLRQCYLLLAAFKRGVFPAQYTDASLAFCMVQHADGRNVLLPHSFYYESAQNGAVGWQYNCDGERVCIPATVEALVDFGTSLVFTLFILRIENGELLHKSAESRCYCPRVIDNSAEPCTMWIHLDVMPKGPFKPYHRRELMVAEYGFLFHRRMPATSQGGGALVLQYTRCSPKAANIPKLV